MSRRHEPDGSRLVRRCFTGMVKSARVDDCVSSVQPHGETPQGGDVGDLTGEIVGPRFCHGAVGSGGGADANGFWEGCRTRWTLAHPPCTALFRWTLEMRLTVDDNFSVNVALLERAARAWVDVAHGRGAPVC